MQITCMFQTTSLCKFCWIHEAALIMFSLYFFPKFTGLRHISVLKMTGKTLDDTSGVLELYPINGEISDSFRSEQNSLTFIAGMQMLCCFILQRKRGNCGLYCRKCISGPWGPVCLAGAGHQKLLPDQPRVFLHAACWERRQCEILVPLAYVVHVNHLRAGGLHAASQAGDGHPAVSRHALPRRRLQSPWWLPWGLSSGLRLLRTVGDVFDPVHSQQGKVWIVSNVRTEDFAFAVFFLNSTMSSSFYVPFCGSWYLDWLSSWMIW